jgi:hypothetical protein
MEFTEWLKQTRYIIIALHCNRSTIKKTTKHHPNSIRSIPSLSLRHQRQRDSDPYSARPASKLAGSFCWLSLDKTFAGRLSPWALSTELDTNRDNRRQKEDHQARAAKLLPPSNPSGASRPCQYTYGTSTTTGHLLVLLFLQKPG